MKRKIIALLLSVTCFSAVLTGCSTSEKTVTEVVDYNSLSLESIVEKAKEEGVINSVAMPDTWANWGETWTEIEEKYGIKHNDIDMSSSEEIALFKEEGKNGTKDIGDVGQQWGPVAEQENVTLKYKTSYWDEVPTWAKDNDGDWIVCYLGTISIITNNALVENPPTSFADILDGDYKVTIGDVSSASQSQHALLATAYALGGSIDNLEPAYEFWSTLASQGRIDTGNASTSRIESGEISVAILWDYNSLNYRDNAVKNNPKASFTVNIPKDASVQSGYASIINVNAPNPYTAMLAREYILSDEGQINLAKGYATPIRESVIIPEDVEAKRIPSEQYESAIVVQDFDKWTDVCKDIITYWEENIIPIIK